MTVPFKAPPVNEVIVGKAFDRCDALLLPFFGRFWDLVQGDFPKVQHAPLLTDEGVSNVAVDPASQLPLPRVWFVSEDEHRLLQLQPDRFFFNWRQQDAGV